MMTIFRSPGRSLLRNSETASRSRFEELFLSKGINAAISRIYFEESFFRRTMADQITKFPNENIGNGIASLTTILLQGVLVIEQLDDFRFTEGGRGSVGVHFRHCVDFVECFVNGIRTSDIDYTLRRRETASETDRQASLSRIRTVLTSLQSLSQLSPDLSVLVRSESEDPAVKWLKSSVMRELEFVQSHTIHHYALIGFKLKLLGFEIDEKFGVSQSTLQFWNNEKANSA